MRMLFPYLGACEECYIDQNNIDIPAEHSYFWIGLSQDFLASSTCCLLGYMTYFSEELDQFLHWHVIFFTSLVNVWEVSFGEPTTHGSPIKLR